MESSKGSEGEGIMITTWERKSRSPNWSDQEIKELVRFRAYYDVLFTGPQRNKSEGWQKVALSLRQNASSACERTARMCETKWANLTHTYHKAELSGEAIEGPLKDVKWFYHNRHNSSIEKEDECEGKGDNDNDIDIDRYITIRHGERSKGFRIEAPAEAIVESILCVFSLPQSHRHRILLADSRGNLHPIDRNLRAYETYTLYIAAPPPL